VLQDKCEDIPVTQDVDTEVKMHIWSNYDAVKDDVYVIDENKKIVALYAKPMSDLTNQSKWTTIKNKIIEAVNNSPCDQTSS